MTGMAKGKKKTVTNEHLAEAIENLGKHLGKKLDTTNERVDALDSRLSGQIDAVALAVNNLSDKVDGLEVKVEGVDKNLSHKLVTLDRRMDDFATYYVKKEEYQKLVKKVGDLTHK